MFLTAALVATTGAIAGTVVLSIGSYLDDDVIRDPSLKGDGVTIASGAPVIDARTQSDRSAA